MSNRNTISVQLTVNDDGSVVMKQFGQNTEQAMNKAGSATKTASLSFNALKGSYLEMTAKAASAYMAMEKAMQYMDMGAKAKQAETSFGHLTAASGESAAAIIANMKRATAGTIDDSQLMQKAVKAMTLDFTTDQITQMAEMARVAARTSGDSVSNVFDNVIDAISTNMPRPLKQYGLINKEQMSQIEQATKDGTMGVNLLSTAVENMNKQQAKFGTLLEDDAEKLQRFRARIEDTKESFGQYLLVAENFTIDKLSNVTGMFMATAASLATGSTSPFKQWQIDLSGYSIGLKEAEAEMARYQASLKKEMDAANKPVDYAESNKRVASFFEAVEKMEKREAEHAQKMLEERRKSALATANEDLKSLEGRLNDYQTYYDSLKAKMDKNFEDERAHLEQLKTLRQQSADIEKSTAALTTGINGTPQGNTLASYESQRSALNMQYVSAMNNLGGQDLIKEMERYKNAVAEVQNQFAKGIPGQGSDWYKSADILSAVQVAEDAISDIERAGQTQMNTMAKLEEQTQSQIKTDQMWGQTIRDEMLTAQNEAQKIIDLIDSLSRQISQMEKTIKLEGVDNVSSVVDDIIVKIEKLHKLAGEQINLNVAYGSSVTSWSSQSSRSSSGSNSGSFLNINSDLDLETRSYAKGTDYVPRTGPYLLHEGEAVIPAAENKAGHGGIVINGGINLQIPAGIAMKNQEDWRMITRNYIVPELKKIIN